MADQKSAHEFCRLHISEHPDTNASTRFFSSDMSRFSKPPFVTQMPLQSFLVSRFRELQFVTVCNPRWAHGWPSATFAVQDPNAHAAPRVPTRGPRRGWRDVAFAGLQAHLS